jgi:hypothetical protein
MNAVSIDLYNNDLINEEQIGRRKGSLFVASNGSRLGRMWKKSK